MAWEQGLIYKYKLPIYKYKLQIYKHSNELRNKGVDLYKHELCTYKINTGTDLELGIYK